MGVIRVEFVGGCSDGEVRDVPDGTKAMKSTQTYKGDDGRTKELVTRYAVTSAVNAAGHRIARPDGAPMLKDKEE